MFKSPSLYSSLFGLERGWLTGQTMSWKSTCKDIYQLLKQMGYTVGEAEWQPHREAMNISMKYLNIPAQIPVQMQRSSFSDHHRIRDHFQWFNLHFHKFLTVCTLLFSIYSNDAFGTKSLNLFCILAHSCEFKPSGNEVIRVCECFAESNWTFFAVCLSLQVSQSPVWTHLLFECLLIPCMTRQNAIRGRYLLVYLFFLLFSATPDIRSTFCSTVSTLKPLCLYLVSETL